MADSMLAMIYERLNASSSYKPFSAQTFSDWASEAGDTVTISRDGTSYSAPLHKQTISWNGSQTVNMETTGNETMDSVATQSAEKLTSTSTGYASSLASYGKLHTFEVNDEHLLYEVFDENGKMARLTVEASQIRSELEDSVNSLYSSITQEASQIRSEVHNAESNLYSAITQTESQIRAEVGDVANSLHSEITIEASQIRSEVSNTANSLHSEITQTASSIRLSISGVTDSSGKVTAASIALAINNAGVSEALIEANKVKISGTTNLNDIMTITDNRVYINGNMRVPGDIMLESITLRETGGGSSSVSISEATVETTIKDASVSGNTLTLTKYNGDTVTFSKATTLSGDWSGSYQAGKKYVVSASPQGVSKESPIVNIIAKYGNPTWASNKKSFDQSVLVSDSDGNAIYLGSINCDTTDSYNTGYNSARMSGSWSGNVLSISKNTTGSTSLSYSVVASASISYDSSTHKYTATANASGGGVVRDTKTSTSGTQAYDAGFNASHTIGIYDTNGRAVSSQTISSAIDLWAGMQKSDGSWQWGSKVTITPSGGSCSGDSASRFPTSASPTDVLAGWNPVYASFNVPDKATGYYRYIKFRVGSAQRSFYFN